VRRQKKKKKKKKKKKTSRGGLDRRKQKGNYEKGEDLPLLLKVRYKRLLMTATQKKEDGGRETGLLEALIK